MSFYGNITSNPLTTYDKIYSNRVMLEENDQSDGILPGRQVLIEYDTTFEMPTEISITEQDKIYIKEQLTDNYSKNAYLDKIKYSQNYDSTIWRKEYYEGHYRYVQVAELNGVGFKFLEFKKNGEKIVTFSGEGTNNTLIINAKDGINFADLGDNKNIEVENSLNLSSTNIEFLSTTKEGDEIILKPNFSMGSSSPEISVKGKNIDFDSSKTLNKSVYEYFTIKVNDENNEYSYRNYNEFFVEDFNEENSYKKITNFDEYLNGTKIYIKDKNNNYKLLGTLNNSQKPIGYNLRSRTTEAKLLVEGTYTGTSIKYNYTLDSNYKLELDVKDFYLGTSIPAELEPYKDSIKTVNISTKCLGASPDGGLRYLEESNFLVNLTQVEEINLDISSSDHGSPLYVTLQKNCFPNHTNLKTINFYLSDWAQVQFDGVGNLGISEKTYIHIIPDEITHKQGEYGSKEIDSSAKIDDSTEIDGSAIIQYYGATEYINSIEGYEDRPRGWTLVHVNPDVIHLDSKEIQSFHREALKNLPNLRSINHSITVEVNEKGEITQHYKYCGYIIKGPKVTDIVYWDLFPYRDSCPQLIQIKNLCIGTSFKTDLIWYRSNEDGYIVGSYDSIEFVSTELPNTLKNGSANNFNEEIFESWSNRNYHYSSMESISDYAFGKNINLLNIDLPKRLHHLGNVFSGCTKLKSIVRRNEQYNLTSVAKNAIPSGVKIYYDGISTDVTYKTLLASIPDSKNLIADEKYKDNLFFIYDEHDYEVYSQSQTPNISNKAYLWTEMNTMYDYGENEDIITSSSSRVLSIRDWENDIIELTIHYMKKACITQDGEEKEIEKAGFDGNTRQYSIIPKSITWEALINRLAVQWGGSFGSTYYHSPEKYQYCEMIEEKEGEYKDINLTELIPFTTSKTIQLKLIQTPQENELKFYNTIPPTESIISYKSTQDAGWDIEIPIIPASNYKFKGWRANFIDITLNYNDGKWSIENRSYNPRWTISDKGKLFYEPIADTDHKEGSFYPIYEEINAPSAEENILLFNAIGTIQGNLLQLNSIPLQGFVKDNGLYIVENEDYANSLLKTSNLLNKEMVGYGYDLSYSTLGNFKIKLKNNQIQCWYLDEDENEVELSAEEAARILGKDYLRCSVTGILTPIKEEAE